MKRWVILLLLFVGVEAALLANDAALDAWTWRATRWFVGDLDSYAWGIYKAEHASDADAPFYRRVDPPMTRSISNPKLHNIEARFFKRTETFWRVARALGETTFTAIMVVVVVLYDRRWWKAGVMLAVATAIAGAAGMLIRAGAGRLRPDGKLLDGMMQYRFDEAGRHLLNEGGNFWYPFRGFSLTASDLSFPSGHAVLAFATAVVLAYLSPRGKVLFFVLAAICAVSRVVMQAHFYSDVLMGAAVGILVGHGVAKWLDRMIPDPQRILRNPDR